MLLPERFAPDGKENHNDHSARNAEENCHKPKLPARMEDGNACETRGVERQRYQRKCLESAARGQPAAGQLADERHQRADGEKEMKRFLVEAAFGKDRFIE